MRPVCEFGMMGSRFSPARSEISSLLRLLSTTMNLEQMLAQAGIDRFARLANSRVNDFLLRERGSRIPQLAHSLTDSEVLRHLWLVDTLEQFADLTRCSFCILPGRYGLLAQLVRSRTPDAPITSFDNSTECEILGRELDPDRSIRFTTVDWADYQPDAGAFNVIICPSCHLLPEHLPAQLLAGKSADTIVVLQSCRPAGRRAESGAAPISELAEIARYRAPNQHYRGALTVGDLACHMVIAQ